MSSKASIDMRGADMSESMHVNVTAINNTARVAQRNMDIVRATKRVRMFFGDASNRGKVGTHKERGKDGQALVRASPPLTTGRAVVRVEHAVGDTIFAVPWHAGEGSIFKQVPH